MKIQDLYEKAATVREETRVALQTIYNEMNQGQQKKIIKDKDVKDLFDRYGVEYTE